MTTVTHTIKCSSIKESEALVAEYCQSLSGPMDSYVEDNLDMCEFHAVMDGDSQIGFFALQKETLWFFYVKPAWLKRSQAIFAEVIESKGIKNVFFQTSDPLLVSLVMDWEFEKRKSAYFFSDASHIPRPELDYATVTFEKATAEDLEYIQKETNNFFSPDDINNGTIFMLRSGDDLLGCGIGVPGKYFTDYVSIGMVTCKAHRRKGVGKFILWSLKEWCYELGLKPIAGCWYYNTLSKKSLEGVGLMSHARGMTAKLLEKEVIPERTGNPPGEPVE